MATSFIAKGIDMKIYNLVIMIQEDDTMTALAYPYSTEDAAMTWADVVEDEFPNAIGYAVVESDIDRGIVSTTH